MNEITFEEVKEFIANEGLEFKPTQDKISFPIISRIHRRLQQGHSFSNIKVVNSVIVDGHHRFICLSLLGAQIEHDPGGENVTKSENLEWKDVLLDEEDYDNEEDRARYAERYDIASK